MDIKKIVEVVTNKDRLPRFLFMFLGVFLLALNYNMFFVEYNLVTGGVSGLSIVFSEWLGWNHEIFIYVVNLALLVLSYFTLGYNKTKKALVRGKVKALVGSILYPLMVTFTLPLSKVLAPYFKFDDFIIVLVLTSIIYGFANGLIYKMGYNTGGSDIIMHIMSKYLHMPEGKANFISSVVIILFAGIIMGVKQVIYSIIITYIFSIIVDRMIIGISKRKLFFIQSEKVEEIEKVIINDLHVGVTILNGKGGYSNKARKVLMCVVPTNDYYYFKEIIQAIDKEAFFIINDCYDIEGGTISSRGKSLDDIF